VSTAVPGRAPAPPEPVRAIEALERLLDAQRAALVDGDVTVLEAIHERIHALLSDPVWKHAAARDRSPHRVRRALRAAALNAGLAARGEAQAARALAAMGLAPSLYTSKGALGARGGPSRGLSA
jgi:hypothetical protein